MKLHFGKPKLKGYLRFDEDGVNVQEADGRKYYFAYREPKPRYHPIKGWLGFSWKGGFVGFIKLGKPYDA